MIPDPTSILGGLLMFVIMLAGFAAMTLRKAPQALALALVACACLAIQGIQAETILRGGFAHFADIAILFTAVAIPAHMIERSSAFRLLLGRAGGQLGNLALARPRAALPIVTSFLLVTTYVLAALGHNTTSILVMTPIAIRLCSGFRIPTRVVLSGMLVASNLGGFSTRWGDTPNIIEARVWQLDNGAFLREILPVNLCVLAALCVAVGALTIRKARRTSLGFEGMSPEQLATTAVTMEQYFCEYTKIDRRLLFVGVASLSGFISLQIAFPELQIVLGALTIVFAVGLERASSRLATLQSLGYETYTVFAAIFVLAGCVEHSWIGQTLQALVARTGAAAWAIALAGYLGTASTEAASWATAAASAIHPLDSSHSAAWALGAGICAGSSSIITAASAGIILACESKRLEGGKHEITFRHFLPFGVAFSLFMLLFYAAILTAFRF